ncbi:hypothetical protein [Kiloniella sp.]|uniref:hypothetical protein n=1 Tax=Kiloniella sp. TaxID=1938587 RepID=UPI003A957A36
MKISTYQHLHNDRMQALTSQINNSLEIGISQISADLGELTDATMYQTAVLSSALSDINDALNDISITLKNRNKTDAFEKLQDGINFYRDGLRFPEEIRWFEKAILHLKSSIEQFERNPIAYYHLGLIYSIVEEYNDLSLAVENFKEALFYGKAEEQFLGVAAQAAFHLSWIGHHHQIESENTHSYALQAASLDRENLVILTHAIEQSIINDDLETGLELAKKLYASDEQFFDKFLQRPLIKNSGSEILAIRANKKEDVDTAITKILYKARLDMLENSDRNSFFVYLNKPWCDHQKLTDWLMGELAVIKQSIPFNIPFEKMEQEIEKELWKVINSKLVDNYSALCHRVARRYLDLGKTLDRLDLDSTISSNCFFSYYAKAAQFLYNKIIEKNAASICKEDLVVFEKKLTKDTYSFQLVLGKITLPSFPDVGDFEAGVFVGYCTFQHLSKKPRTANRGYTAKVYNQNLGGVLTQFSLYKKSVTKPFLAKHIYSHFFPNDFLKALKIDFGRTGLDEITIGSGESVIWPASYDDHFYRYRGSASKSAYYQTIISVDRYGFDKNFESKVAAKNLENLSFYLTQFLANSGPDRGLSRKALGITDENNHNGPYFKVTDGITLQELSRLRLKNTGYALSLEAFSGRGVRINKIEVNFPDDVVAVDFSGDNDSFKEMKEGKENAFLSIDSKGVIRLHTCIELELEDFGLGEPYSCDLKKSEYDFYGTGDDLTPLLIGKDPYKVKRKETVLSKVKSLWS